MRQVKLPMQQVASYYLRQSDTIATLWYTTIDSKAMLMMYRQHKWRRLSTSASGLKSLPRTQTGKIWAPMIVLQIRWR